MKLGLNLNAKAWPKSPRMAEAGRDLRVQLSQPLLQQGYPEQRDWDHIQAASGDLWEGDLTASGCLCHHFIIHTALKCCLMVRENLPCSSLWPVALVLALGATVKSLPLCTTPSVMRSPSAFSTLSSHRFSQPFLTGEVLHHCFGSSLYSLQYVHASLILGRQNWTNVPSLRSAKRRGRITSLILLAILGLTQPRIGLAFLAVRARCWLLFNSASASAPPFLQSS